MLHSGMDDDTLERDLRLAYGAYAYLRDNAGDLAAVSATARLLRAGDAAQLAHLARRAADELAELRGVVAGTHGHGGGRADVVLEAYQCIYWLTLLAVAAGDRYDDVRSHLPLTRGDDRAAALSDVDGADLQDAGRRRDLLTLGLAGVGVACRQAGVPVSEAARRDLDELRAKTYLASYWAEGDQSLAELVR